MSNLVFIDTETTGLEPEKHEVWEIAFAIDKGAISCFQVPHSLLTADPEALNINNYWSRVRPSEYRNNHSADPTMRKIVKGATLVASNPTFDRMMLRARWGSEPWHHRSIALETQAMTVFGWDIPRGMKDVSLALEERGYSIPAPNHTATRDVEALRASYYALRDIQRKYIEAYTRITYSGPVENPTKVQAPRE